MVSCDNVGRVYDLNAESLYVSSDTADAHHLGTNNVNSDEDPWSKTHDPVTGWPFGLFDGEPATQTEPMRALGADVTTGDIWGEADDFVFAHLTDATSAVWETSVSTPNSHVHQWAKGCLMARDTLDQDSAYFAVCSPADKRGRNGIGGNKGRLRVQYRDSVGRGTADEHVDILEQDEGEDAIDEESLTFIRLEVTPDGTGTCATGYGSQDGETWVEIHSRCFDESLTLHGVATSSHGDDPVKFIYSRLWRWGLPVFAADLQVSVVGDGSGEVFDGFCSPSRGC